jgi:hypothetical protein
MHALRRAALWKCTACKAGEAMLATKTGIKSQTIFDHDLPEADAVDAPAKVPFVLCDLPLFLLPLLLFFLPLSPLNLAAACASFVISRFFSPAMQQVSLSLRQVLS